MNWKMNISIVDAGANEIFLNGWMALILAAATRHKAENVGGISANARHRATGLAGSQGRLIIALATARRS
jgi:hypothetical protein